MLCRAGVEESDEFCPHCDNHYVVEAVEPRPVLTWESDDPRVFAHRDGRIRPPASQDVREDELLELLAA